MEIKLHHENVMGMESIEIYYKILNDYISSRGWCEILDHGCDSTGASEATESDTVRFCNARQRPSSLAFCWRAVVSSFVSCAFCVAYWTIATSVSLVFFFNEAFSCFVFLSSSVICVNIPEEKKDGKKK